MQEVISKLHREGKVGAGSTWGEGPTSYDEHREGQHLPKSRKPVRHGRCPEGTGGAEQPQSGAEGGARGRSEGFGHSPEPTEGFQAAE